MMRFTKSHYWLSLCICILSLFVWPGRASCVSSVKAIGLVAVITDFGTTDFYIGAMQGAMYTVNPLVRIATITHEVEPFNVVEGSYILTQAAREFPSGTVFLAVVDPGVGTGRRPIVLQTRDEKLFVAPDNGLLTGVMEAFGVAHAYEITNRSLMRQGTISATFHGRDLYGPVAAHLSGGTKPSEVGPEITDPVRLPIVKARREEETLVGFVVHVDRYGNLITNITGILAKEAGLVPGAQVCITIGEHRLSATFTDTYNDVPKGDWLALVNAEHVVEIACNLANAARTIGAAAGAQLRVELTQSPIAVK
ncbi:MAG: SAM-dependent chlorinase/fluorinase [Deltaproteobacteria bacterium]|nr:SAM-dependent chlorinase/fluorinase [Deltaproteobacteria bacterium]